MNIVSTADVPKKRGRKPKGGKITSTATSTSIPTSNANSTAIHTNETITEPVIRPNIIVHLKCSLADLNRDSDDIIKGYDNKEQSGMFYDILQYQNDTPVHANGYMQVKQTDDYFHNHDVNIFTAKSIANKLKTLEYNLRMNNVLNTRSACFWCTEHFESQTIFIPKCYVKDHMSVYGSFCTPECAAAYLMNENIDSSAKFERYFLLNHLYSPIFNYKKRIKPAPSPFYMLDKFLGNLSIAEFRALSQSEKIYLTIEKPITRVLPEFHEDNDEYILTTKIIPSHSQQPQTIPSKKTHQKSKLSSITENFSK